MSSSKLKTAFKKAHTIGPLHTGGPVALTPDGTRIVTCIEDEILLTEVDTGVELGRFVGDTQAITAMCVTPDGSQLLLFTSALALRIYPIPSTPSNRIHPTHVLARAHDAPVHTCTADPSSTYLASGSADGVAKVFRIHGPPHATHAFKGHGGVVSALAFNYPAHFEAVPRAGRKMQLITASVDTRVRIFDLAGSSKPEAVLEGHVSVPRGLSVSKDGRWLISGGRDSVVLVWDLSSLPEGKKGKGTVTLAKTIPILERVEAVGLLEEEALRFFTAGSKGVVRIWDARSGDVVSTLGHEPEEALNEDEEEGKQIVSAMYIPSTATIISVHADQNILFHSATTHTLTRQLVGFNDEIVDATFLSSAYLALATNSSLIRVYTTATRDARLLRGHTGIVLCLAASASGRMLVSGSKDRSARIWSQADDGAWGCVGVCEGHAESIGALAVSDRCVFTGSQDRTIKMWELPSVHNGQVAKCRSLTTQRAHEKDINALALAPTSALLASASQDRTAKIFAVADAGLRLLGVCKGHKRGVWSAKFARGSRVLATGSADRTVKLWGVDDFACVGTFEGHTNSVLRVDFLGGQHDGVGKGQQQEQLVSSGSDGLVKLWDMRTEECVCTLDGHEDKVWALAVSADGRTIVSGAADSVVNMWEDCTEEREVERENKRAESALKEQDFTNYLALHDYRRAIELALAMAQPGRLLSLFTSIHTAPPSPSPESSPSTSPAHQESLTGHAAVDTVLRTLPHASLAQLLRYVRAWNASARTSGVAQRVLHAILKLRRAEDVLAAISASDVNNDQIDGDEAETRQVGKTSGGGAKELVDALIPYTERHLARMERLVQESYVVDYVLAEMDDGMFIDGEVDGLDGDVEMVEV